MAKKTAIAPAQDEPGESINPAPGRAAPPAPASAPTAPDIDEFDDSPIPPAAAALIASAGQDSAFVVRVYRQLQDNKRSLVWSGLPEDYEESTIADAAGGGSYLAMLINQRTRKISTNWRFEIDARWKPKGSGGVGAVGAPGAVAVGAPGAAVPTDASANVTTLMMTMLQAQMQQTTAMIQAMVSRPQTTSDPLVTAIVTESIRNNRGGGLADTIEALKLAKEFVGDGGGGGGDASMLAAVAPALLEFAKNAKGSGAAPPAGGGDRGNRLRAMRARTDQLLRASAAGPIAKIGPGAAPGAGAAAGAGDAPAAGAVESPAALTPGGAAAEADRLAPGNALNPADLMARARELVILGHQLGWSEDETAGNVGMSIDRMDDDSAEFVWSAIDGSNTDEISGEIGIGPDHPIRVYALGVAAALKLMAADDGEEPEAPEAGEGNGQ